MRWRAALTWRMSLPAAFACTNAATKPLARHDHSKVDVSEETYPIATTKSLCHPIRTPSFPVQQAAPSSSTMIS